MPATRLQVTPIAGEPDRFLVASQSRPGLEHVVDMNFEGKPGCGCEDFFCKDTPPDSCKHIEAVRAFLSQPENLRKLRAPVPVIGRQGLFNLPPDVEAKVREQL